MELKELVCVVTGGGGSVGQALVAELARQGATVVAVRHGEPTGEIEPNNDHYLVHGELVKRLSADAIVEHVVAKFGRIDAWINTVGGFQGGTTVESATAEEWKQMMAVNFITTLNSCQAVLPHMKERRTGWIINFGSYLGEKGMALASPYAVSKAAVHALTKTITEENKDLNIVARALLPTVIDTPANRKAMPDEDTSQWLLPEDVAQAVTRLLRNGTVGTAGPEEVLIHLSVNILQEAAEAETDILSIFDEVVGVKEDHPAEPITEPGEPSSETTVEEPELETAATPEVQTAAAPTAEETPHSEAATMREANEPSEAETENDITPDSELATFSMVTHLKTRGLYRQALEVLEALTKRGEDLDRINQERMEITEMMTPGVEPKVSEDSAGAAPDEKEEPIPETVAGEGPAPPPEAEEAPPQESGEGAETATPAPQEEQVEDLNAMPPDVVEDQGTSEPSTPEKGGPIRTTTAFLILLLVAITGLGIQDWVSPEASLVSRMIQAMLGTIPLHSRSSTATPPSLQSAAVTGFIDTLLDQNAEEPEQEAQPAAVDTAMAASVEAGEPAEPDTTEAAPTTTGMEDTVVVAPPAEPETPVGAAEPTAVEETVEKEPPVAEASPPNPQELFQEGQFHEAAQAWLKVKQASPAGYTIVLEYVCLDQTIRNAYQAVEASPDLFLLPKQIQERDCFVICLGEFPDKTTALEQLTKVPSWFQENGAQPRVRPLAKLLP